MIQLWGMTEDKKKNTAISLTLPARLGDGATLRLLGEAFDTMIAALIDQAEIKNAAEQAGYTHVLTEDLTPSLQLQSFRHLREEHRLYLHTHRYPKYVRQVLHLTIPGGLSLKALERFRLGRDCVGCTYYWHDHIYGEWRTSERLTRSVQFSGLGNSPVFIELRQDSFDGEPLMLRVTFHRLLHMQNAAVASEL